MSGNRFLMITALLALVFSYFVWEFVFGAPDDRFGLNYIYAGGFLVVLLMTLLLLIIALLLERIFALAAASGRQKYERFIVGVIHAMENSDYQRASQLCIEQEGVCGNVLAAGLRECASDVEEGKESGFVRSSGQTVDASVPVLEQNLAGMSTIASISTMIGLLGTTIGMIRSFKALAQTGAPDAVQLSIGISEALINTAGGLIVAIIAIVGYNACSHKVDQLLQQTDEAVTKMRNVIRLNRHRPSE